MQGLKVLAIPADEYRSLLRALNDTSEPWSCSIDWCKKAILALKQGKPIEPYRVFLSGPGGVGKSHVIQYD